MDGNIEVESGGYVPGTVGFGEKGELILTKNGTYDDLPSVLAAHGVDMTMIQGIRIIFGSESIHITEFNVHDYPNGELDGVEIVNAAIPSYHTILLRNVCGQIRFTDCSFEFGGDTVQFTDNLCKGAIVLVHPSF